MPYKNLEKQREYQRQWMARRKAEYFSNKNCSTCGRSEQLEIDHIDPSTKLSHKIWSWSKIRREEELAKCQVLCKDCHLTKSKKEKIKGEDCSYSKLTYSQVQDIRTRYRNSEISQRKLAKEYNVSQHHISVITRNKVWK
jgi:hypothetical protein